MVSQDRLRLRDVPEGLKRLAGPHPEPDQLPGACLGRCPGSLSALPSLRLVAFCLTNPARSRVPSYLTRAVPLCGREVRPGAYELTWSPGTGLPMLAS